MENIEIGKDIKVPMMTNSILIGEYAGADMTHGDKIVIIGDNIRSLDKSQPNVIFIQDWFAIGKTVMGQPNTLYDILKTYGTEVK